MEYTEKEIEELLARQREQCAVAYIKYVSNTLPSDWDDYDAWYAIKSAEL